MESDNTFPFVKRQMYVWIMIACAKLLLCKEKLKLKYFNFPFIHSSFQTFITEIDLLLFTKKLFQNIGL